MTGAILLILSTPGDGDEEIGLKRVGDRRDVVISPRRMNLNKRMAEKAFLYAQQHAKRVVALLILSSDLYHWGTNDIILPGPAKAKFSGHIREALFNRSMEQRHMLEKMAFRYGVPLEFRPVETDDPVASALMEARQGYERIFMLKERKRLFPILKKTMEQCLRKGTSVPLSICR